MIRLALAFLAPAMLAMTVACGGDDGDTSAPTATVSADVTPGQPRDVDDLGYLDVFCSGIARYFDAVDTATTADEIADAVEAFTRDLEGVTPPEDVRPFHQAFIDYLRASADDPTSLLVDPPPVPPEDVRDRLAGKESEVDSCKASEFFSSRDPNVTPTPAF